jgi:hypothetical protein
LKDTLTRAALIRSAWRHGARPDEALCVTDHRGIRLLGPTEEALQRAIAELRSRHGDALVFEPPAIRYIHGAMVLEPWMHVLVNVPSQYGFLIKHDFVRRRGDIRRLDQRGAAFVLEGEAPLAKILGYADWLKHASNGEPAVALRLSRYLPVNDDNGPAAA